MSKILDLYSEVLKKRERFVDEIFEDESYKEARPKFTVVDIGAYQGEFSFYCLPFSSKIYAIEPDPRPYAIMEEYIKNFGLEKDIFPFRLAIGAKTEDRSFSASGFGGSAFAGSNGPETITVQTVTLEDFMVMNDIEHIDILKMDCESAEKEILTSPNIEGILRKVGLVIGEQHGCADLVGDVLSKNGFNVTFQGTTFWARKP